MFNFGFFELIILGAIALIVVGPEKFPEFAKTLGKGLTMFKKNSNELKRTIADEIYHGAGKKGVERAT